jgi:hypothetical protein
MSLPSGSDMLEVRRSRGDGIEVENAKCHRESHREGQDEAGRDVHAAR